MYRPWLVAFGLEIAWLGVLWFSIPESRPWCDEASTGVTSRGAWRSRVESVLLFVYTFYHFPGLLLAELFYLLTGGFLRGKPFPFRRVRPGGFLILAGINGLAYSMIWTLAGI